MTNITLAEAAAKLSATQLTFAEIDFEAARFTANEIDVNIDSLVETGVDFHKVTAMLSAIYSAKQLEHDPLADIDGIGAAHYEQLAERLLEELILKHLELEEEFHMLAAEHDSYLQSKFNLLKYGEYGEMLYSFV